MSDGEGMTRRQALGQMGAAGMAFTLGSQIVLRGTETWVAARPVEIRLAAVSSSTIRITVEPLGHQSGSIPPKPDGILVEDGAGRVIERDLRPDRSVAAGDLVVRFTDHPPTIVIETRMGDPVQRLVLDAKSPILRFALGKGRIFGLGEGGPQFDRRGSSYGVRNGQGGYQLRTHGARVSVPWIVSTDGWAFLVPQPAGAIDLSGEEGTFTPADDERPLDLFVAASPDPRVLMQEYARITGHAQLPPLWSFGYMQSHRTLAGPAEIEAVARTFREKQLPCDALIYLGTEFTPSGWNTRNGEFAWKPENFPNPKRAIDEMHARHFKIVLHIVIEGRRMSGVVSDACTPDRAVPSGRTPDDRWPDDRAVPCYWPYHKPLYDLGVDGMWPDQGDGLDQASRLARIRMYWEGPQRYRPDERPFALHRNGAPGMQRYGAFLWSGDVFSLWETLATHVPIAINTGLSGIPFWGTDIGGFVTTTEYTGELHVRWFQFGAFCPLFRAHGRNWRLRLPWGWNEGTFGPSETRPDTVGAGDPDPSELRNPRVEPIVKKYLELRYRMLPYIYTIARECTETGLPMMRALWLHYAEDPRATARGDQFLWGRDILVSPVVEKGATHRRLYVPRGVWFDFWTEERLDGGRDIDRAVDLETIPLHVRAGAILPFGPLRQYVDEPVDGPLAVTIYPGADGAFELYEDDGKSFAYLKGDWMGMAMTWSDAARRFTVRLSAGSRMRAPAARSLDVRIAGQRDTRRVVFEGKTIDVQL